MYNVDDYENDKYEKLYQTEGENKVRGILLIFYIWMISLTHLDMLFVCLPYYNTLKNALYGTAIPGLDIIGRGITAVAWFLVVYGIFVGILIYKLQKIAVKLAKVYIILKLAFFSLLLISAFTFDMLNTRRMEELVMEFVLTFTYVVVTSIGWYIYLNKSKKVKISYGIEKRQSIIV